MSILWRQLATDAFRLQTSEETKRVDEDGDAGDFTDNDDELDPVDGKMNTEGVGDAQDNSPAVDDDPYTQIVRPIITRS